MTNRNGNVTCMRTKNNGLFVLVAMVVDYSKIGKIGFQNKLFTKKIKCYFQQRVTE